MFSNKYILAIILARGGSKGVPRKNIKPLAEKPLIAWTIEEAKKSKYIDRIIVSTDDCEIADISKSFGADVPFIRPQELAQDTSTSEEAILHTINWLKKNEKVNYEVFILLQPTSPLRTACHIDEALELFSNSDASCLYSVVDVNQTPYKMKAINFDGYLKDFIMHTTNFKRRQDFPKLFYPNGAIYISEINVFKRLLGFDETKLLPYFMDYKDSIDIDNELDFLFLETLLKTN